MTLPDQIRADGEAGTPGPWEWWTSNSRRRLKVGPGRHHGDNILEGITLHDGATDIVISDADMRRIARVPELEEIAFAAEELLAAQDAGASAPGYVPDLARRFHAADTRLRKALGETE